MISRQKLIEELKNWQGDIHDNEYDASEHDFVFERIYEIITDQPPADQWIPCSEELPEGYTTVIACSTDGNRHLNYYMTERGYWYYYKDEITAWMPLPEPYKEVE